MERGDSHHVNRVVYPPLNLEQVIVLSDNMSENQIEGKRSTNLQIFKVFETLLGLFNALSVIYRKGIDK